MLTAKSKPSKYLTERFKSDFPSAFEYIIEDTRKNGHFHGLSKSQKMTIATLMLKDLTEQKDKRYHFDHVYFSEMISKFHQFIANPFNTLLAANFRQDLALFIFNELEGHITEMYDEAESHAGYQQQEQAYYQDDRYDGYNAATPARAMGLVN
jgi:hypothetical protein